MRARQREWVSEKERMSVWEREWENVCERESDHDISKTQQAFGVEETLQAFGEYWL